MDFAAARQNMVECQIRPNRVNEERLVEAIRAVPREIFVPDALRGVAYVDEELEIAPGRVVVEPTVLARLIQALSVKATDRALDLGTGTGYAAAVLSLLADEVVALESDADLAAKAKANLEAVQATNVTLVTGALKDGAAEQGPYDAILFGGGVSEVPVAVIHQLKDGGRLVAVLSHGGEGTQGHAILITRTGNLFGHAELFDAAATLLPGLQPQPHFVF